VRDLDGRLLLANRRLEEILGIPHGKAYGLSHYDFFPREVVDEMLKSDRQVLATGAAQERELTLPEPGAVRTYISVKCPLPGEGGEPDAICVIATDITDRKRAEAEFNRYQEHLEDLVTQRTEELTRSNESLKNANRELARVHAHLLLSEKMASIGQLAAGVAHEINNPVAFIHSNVTTLESYLRHLLGVVQAYEPCDRMLPPDQLVAVQAAKEEADFEYVRSDIDSLLGDTEDGLDRVKRIIHALRQFSRPGESKWQLTDLRPGIESTLNLLRSELEHKASVIVEYGEVPPVECLPSDLNQLFMNLLVNAAQAIHDRGIISVRTGSVDQELWVEIEDSGEGIAPENLHRIFDPFFTTKPVGKGTGLGLALSYRIVENHHGRIEVESDPGRGSKFRVWLPLRQTGPPAAR